MIRCALPIDEIAERLAGDVASRTMVRAPAVGAASDDRSLVVVKTAAGLIVLPAVTGGDFRTRSAEMEVAQAFVASRVGEAA